MIGVEKGRRKTSGGSAIGPGYDLFFWKVPGNDDKTQPEPGDWCVGKVNNTFLQGFYLGGGLDDTANFDAQYSNQLY